MTVTPDRGRCFRTPSPVKEENAKVTVLEWLGFSPSPPPLPATLPPPISPSSTVLPSSITSPPGSTGRQLGEKSLDVQEGRALGSPGTLQPQAAWTPCPQPPLTACCASVRSEARALACSLLPEEEPLAQPDTLSSQPPLLRTEGKTPGASLCFSVQIRPHYKQ